MVQKRETKKVLIAEGSPSFRETLREILSRARFEVMVADDGKKARELLESAGSEIDLLLLDLHFPETEGFDLLSWLKEGESSKRPPILAMTATYDILETLHRLHGLEAVGIQDKRTAKDQIVYRINSLLYYKKGEQRANLRAASGIPANFHIGGHKSQGIISNISGKGMFLRIDSPIPDAPEIHLQFILPGIPRLFEIKGRVVWMAKATDRPGPSGLGIEFLDLDEKGQSQIGAFVQWELQRLGPAL